VATLDGYTYRLFYSVSLTGSLLGLFIRGIYSELLYSSLCLYIWGQLPVKLFIIKQFIQFYAAHTITHITVISIRINSWKQGTIYCRSFAVGTQISRLTTQKVLLKLACKQCKACKLPNSLSEEEARASNLQQFIMVFGMKISGDPGQNSNEISIRVC
jgi:hypothetical protein